MIRSGHHSRKRIPWLALVAMLPSEAALAQEAAQFSNSIVAAAEQETANSGVCYGAPATEVYVPMQGGTVDVPVFPNQTTPVTFPPWIVLKKKTATRRGFVIKQEKNTLTVRARPGVDPGTQANFVVISAMGKLKTNVSFKMSDETERRTKFIDVKPVSKQEYVRLIEKRRHERQDRARVAAERAREAAERERKATVEARWQVRKETAQVLVDEIPDDQYGDPTADDGFGHVPRDQRREVYAVLGRVSLYKGYRYLRFRVHNPRTTTEHKLAVAQFLEGNRKAVPVEVVMEKKVKTAGDAFAIIPPRSSVRGIVLIPDGVQADIDKWRLRFFAPKATRPLIAATQRIDWVPIPHKEAVRRRRAKQVAVIVGVVTGAYWLNDGDGQGLSDGTFLTAVAVRYLQGFHKNFAFEAEGMGGKTGEAEFKNMSWNGMNGDVARSATFGRVRVGGLLRLGDKYIPTVRLGLAGQGTSHSSLFSTGATSMDGPGSSFDFSALLDFGIGFDVRVGEHFLAGVAASMVNVLSGPGGNDGFQSLELGMHASYAWSP